MLGLNKYGRICTPGEVTRGNRNVSLFCFSNFNYVENFSNWSRYYPYFGILRYNLLRMSNVKDYIVKCQSLEEYSFSWNELSEYCNAPESTIRKELVRLIESKELINLRQGFYLIVPPRYRNLGKVPLQLFIDKLFKSLKKEYYVGLYSAATFHGASHQQIQQDYVITEPPALRMIKKKNNTTIHFYKTVQWPKGNLSKRKSDAGTFIISSQALTIVDLIQHQNVLGGINRMLANIEELLEEMTANDLKELLTWYSNKSNLQRMGYLMEYHGVGEEITGILYNKLKENKFYPVVLTPKKGVKPGAVDNRWKVDVNIQLENDL